MTFETDTEAPPVSTTVLSSALITQSGVLTTS